MNKLILNLLVLAAGIACTSSHASIMAPPTPVPELIKHADVVVVGRVTSSNTTEKSGFIRQSVALMPDRVLKGGAPPSTTLAFTQTGSTTDATLISDSQYGLFFLKRAADGSLAPVDANYPVLPAVPESPLANRPAVPLDAAVATELAQVFTVRPTELLDSRTGVGSQIVADSDSGKAHLIYLGAQQALNTIPRDVTQVVLHKINSAGGTPLSQVWTVDALLNADDETALDTVVPLIQNPNADTISAIRKLGFDIGATAKRPESLNSLIALSKSPVPEMKLGATTALRRFTDPSATAALKAAMRDPDFDVRYAAVSGMAISTHQMSRLPTVADFKARESEHIQYWDSYKGRNTNGNDTPLIYRKADGTSGGQLQ